MLQFALSRRQGHINLSFLYTLHLSHYRATLQMLLSQPGIKIMVGDPHQHIYS